MMLHVDQLEAGVMTSWPDVTHLTQQAAANQNNSIRQHFAPCVKLIIHPSPNKGTIIETSHLDFKFEF